MIQIILGFRGRSAPIENRREAEQNESEHGPGAKHPPALTQGRLSGNLSPESLFEPALIP